MAHRQWQVVHRNTSPLPVEFVAIEVSWACGAFPGPAPTRSMQSGQGVKVGMDF